MSTITINKPSTATRLRDRIAGLSGDGGFTLLETLAVMVIVGLLAAITIPQISKWREKAYVTAMKSDAHNVSLAIEANYVDTQAYPADTTALNALISSDVKLNSNVAVENNTYTATADSYSFTLSSTKTSKQVVFNSAAPTGSVITVTG